MTRRAFHWAVGLVALAAPASVAQTWLVGADAGGAPAVVVFDAATGEPRSVFDPFPSATEGGVRVALGDVDGDLVPDVIVGSGAGGEVKVYSGNGGFLLADFAAFPTLGGVHVAHGDLGLPSPGGDLITGSGAGVPPAVRVFDGTGSFQFELIPFEPSFQGGVRVAAGDVDDDGVDDIITGAGPGSPPKLRVFSGLDQQELWSVDVFGGLNLGGVHVRTLDANDDGIDDVVVSGGDSPIVKILDGADGSDLFEFAPFGGGHTGGIRVAAGAIFRGGRPGLVAGSGDVAKIFRVQRGGVSEVLEFDPAAFGGFGMALPPLPSELLLVNDGQEMGDEGPFVAALDPRGVSYDYWTVPEGQEPGPLVLERYSRVVWFTGNAGEDAGPNGEGEFALGGWLDLGGCLLLTSQEYLSNHPSLTPFLTDDLGVSGGSFDVGALQVQGVGGPFVGLGPYELDHPFPDRSDALSLGAGAEPAMEDEGVLKAVYRGIEPQARTAFFAFPLESIFGNEERFEILDAFFRGCPDFRNETFVDGFESGNTSAWSTTVN